MCYLFQVINELLHHFFLVACGGVTRQEGVGLQVFLDVDQEPLQCGEPANTTTLHWAATPAAILTKGFSPQRLPPSLTLTPDSSVLLVQETLALVNVFLISNDRKHETTLHLCCSLKC